MLVEKNPEKRIRVLLMPWLSHGHASSFLELGKRLMKRNMSVYYCSTPANLKSINPKIPKEKIEVVELHLPSSPELPPHYHTTNGLPPHLMPALIQAVDGSSSSIRHLLSVVRPDFFIYDIFPSCSSTIAHSLSIPSAIYLTGAAASVCSSIFPDKCSDDFPFIDESHIAFGKVFTHGAPDLSIHTMALVKTFRDIDGKFLDYMGSQTRVIPVGPLVEDLEIDDKGREMLQWLDEREEASTIYVSFGSECYLSKEEIREVAVGLEKAGVGFLWVLRFHDRDNSGIEEVLPAGFLSRIGESGGKIVEWAPQAKVLGHRSIGGFVSHCGWGSLIESMKCGVPIIGVPMLYDQPMNSKLVADFGVGIEMKRGEGGNIVGEEVAKTVRALMVDQTGDRIRKKVAELGNTLKNNEDAEMDEVVKEIQKLGVK